MYRLVWSREALDDLEELRSYIAADNPRAALGVFVRIVDLVALLPQQPDIGRPGRVPGTRELVVPNTPCIVAYSVVGADTVRVLGVRHGARKWPESFSNE